ncbi:MAG: hypothetical protein AB7E72_18205 [Lysobacterales bacterium]
MSFLSELKRRNVIRMAGLYIVGAWLFVQVAETLLPIFDTPAWVLKALVLLLALGFVPALVFSWIFELTPEGLKRDSEVTQAPNATSLTARRMDQLIVLGMIAVVGVVIADRYWPRQPDAAVPDASADAVTVAAAVPATQPGDDAPSIAVLPFANLSSDPEQEYFSDGMTEELLNVLAKIPGLKVAARTSVFEFKGKGGDIREIGGKLGVSHIVEGSVRRDGQDIRVTAQLIRVADGFHVWSETYDRKLESVFALQDDLANRVGSALQTSLGMVAPAAPRLSIQPEAYDHYLKGRALLRSREDIAVAIEHFKSAVALEPGFAAGWTSLSLSYDVGIWYVPNASPAEFLVQQGDAARRAALIEPDSAAVNHALGNLARNQFKYAEAERRYLQAMRIDPGYPDVREDYAELLNMVGRARDSRAAALQLVELDPYFGIGWVRVHDTAVHFDLRSDVEDAIARLRVLNPDSSSGKFGLLDYAVIWGRVAEAQQRLAEVAERWPEDARIAQMLLPWALEGQELDEAQLHAALAQAPAGEALYYLVARQALALYNAEIERSGATLQSLYFAYLNDNQAKGHPLLRDPEVKSRLRAYGFVDYWREKGWPEACRPLGETDFECGIDADGAP